MTSGLNILTTKEKFLGQAPFFLQIYQRKEDITTNVQRYSNKLKVTSKKEKLKTEEKI